MNENETEKTPRQLKKEAREQAQRERLNKAEKLKGEYARIEKSPALVDLMAKIKNMSDYHNRLAKDGVGYKTEFDADGQPREVQVYFTPDQKLDHLSKSAGIDEIADYIDRLLA